MDASFTRYWFQIKWSIGLLIAVPIAGFIKGTFDTIRGVNTPKIPEAIAEAHTESSLK